MKQKIVGGVAACACIFMFVAGGMGISDILEEAEEGTKQTEEALEQLDTLKAGVETLEENRASYEEGLVAYETGLAQYEAGKAEYEKGKTDLAAGKEEYEAGKKTLAAGKAEYAKGQKDLADGKAEYEKGMQDYETGLATYNAAIANKDALILQQTEAQMSTAQVQAMITENIPTGVQVAALQAMGFSEEQIEQVSAGQLTLDSTQLAILNGAMSAIQSNSTAMAQVQASVTAQVQAGVKEKVAEVVDATLVSSKQELDAGKAKLEAAAVTIADGEKQLAAAKKEIADGEKQLAAAETEIAAGEVQLADAEVQLADAEVQLADGKAQLEVFEKGQAQVDAGYATLLENEKIAAKVDDGMEILDAGYEVVEEENLAGTEDLMGRATYIGIAMAAALIALIGVAVVWFNKRAVVVAAIALVAAIVANVHGFSRNYHEEGLQMAAMIIMAVTAAIFTGVCAMKKKVVAE